MNYSEYYIESAKDIRPVFNSLSAQTGWQCPSNIALVKYWGKKGIQLPMNPSLSFTLSRSFTECLIDFQFDTSIETPQIEYYFEDKPEKQFEIRIAKYLSAINHFLPFLSKTNLTIRTKNTFPHSAGIASSASSFGALALCLVSIEEKLTGNIFSDEAFRRKASFLARLGSGSACRSVYKTASLWGETYVLKNSSNEIAVPFWEKMDQVFKTYKDIILVIDDSAKAISSSKGHQLMTTNPYSETRIKQANNNLKRLISAMQAGDLDVFSQITENEALTLHGLMMTSEPGYFLLKQASINVIDRIRQFRDVTKVPVTFTLDAGPNIHLLFPEESSEIVFEFVNSELVQYCRNGGFIVDKVGQGPEKIY